MQIKDKEALKRTYLPFVFLSGHRAGERSVNYAKRGQTWTWAQLNNYALCT